MAQLIRALTLQALEPEFKPPHESLAWLCVPVTPASIIEGGDGVVVLRGLAVQSAQLEEGVPGGGHRGGHFPFNKRLFKAIK